MIEMVNKQLMALLSCLIVSKVMAFNKNNKLVDYRDRITVYNSTDPNTVTYTMDLMSFPYMTNVSHSLIRLC